MTGDHTPGRESAQSPADRIAADLVLISWDSDERALLANGYSHTGAASLAPVGGDDTSRVAPVNCAHCGEPAPHCQHSDALFAGVIA